MTLENHLNKTMYKNDKTPARIKNPKVFLKLNLVSELL